MLDKEVGMIRLLSGTGGVRGTVKGLSMDSGDAGKNDHASYAACFNNTQTSLVGSVLSKLRPGKSNRYTLNLGPVSLPSSAVLSFLVDGQPLDTSPHADPNGTCARDSSGQGVKPRLAIMTPR